MKGGVLRNTLPGTWEGQKLVFFGVSEKGLNLSVGCTGEP